MAGTWDLRAKTSNTNLGYYYYPAAWEDSGKIYVKAQGEWDVNVYDIATNVWSNLATYTPGNGGNPYGSFGDSTYIFESCPLRHELLWTTGSYLYIFHSGWYGTSSPYQRPFLWKSNKSTGAIVSGTVQSATFGTLDASSHGNWGRNRHKAVVRDDTSGKIYLINFYTKQIYEFVAASDTFTLVKTWTESVGGVSTDDVTGCDAVCLNGKIYIMGKHSYAANSGGIEGPLEIDIATWSTATKAAYPDYGNIANQTYNHYCDTQWFPIGNLVYGYGGRMQSTANADGSGTSESDGNILRKVAFDTINNSWSDLAAIADSFLYASALGVNAAGFLLGGYIGGAGTQITHEFTYLPMPVSGIGIGYNYSTKTLTINWAYEDESPSAFMIDYKKSTDTSWSTEYGCDAIGGAVRSVAITYLAATVGGESCYSITYTLADTSTEIITAATTAFLLSANDLETAKYLFRITPVAVI